MGPLSCPLKCNDGLLDALRSPLRQSHALMGMPCRACLVATETDQVRFNSPPDFASDIKSHAALGRLGSRHEPPRTPASPAKLCLCTLGEPLSVSTPRISSNAKCTSRLKQSSEACLVDSAHAHSRFEILGRGMPNAIVQCHVAGLRRKLVIGCIISRMNSRFLILHFRIHRLKMA
jgi:hypothetical protein